MSVGIVSKNKLKELFGDTWRNKNKNKHILKNISWWDIGAVGFICIMLVGFFIKFQHKQALHKNDPEKNSPKFDSIYDIYIAFLNDEHLHLPM